MTEERYLVFFLLCNNHCAKGEGGDFQGKETREIQ